MRERTPSAIFAEEEAGVAGCSSAVSAELVLVLGGPPRVLVLEGLNVEDAHQKAFSN